MSLSTSRTGWQLGSGCEEPNFRLLRPNSTVAFRGLSPSIATALGCWENPYLCFYPFTLFSSSFHPWCLSKYFLSSFLGFLPPSFLPFHLFFLAFTLLHSFRLSNPLSLFPLSSPLLNREAPLAHSLLTPWFLPLPRPKLSWTLALWWSVLAGEVEEHSFLCVSLVVTGWEDLKGCLRMGVHPRK